MFYLEDFKNFAQASIDDDNPVTLLIGPNGAGKSNVIEGVELLSFLAGGRPLHEITDLGREGGLEARGGLEACARLGRTSFKLGHHSMVQTPEGEREAHYEISIRVGKEPRIEAEFLRIEGREAPVFEVLSSEVDSISADNLVRYDNHARGGSKPAATVAADRSAISQYARFAHKNRKLAESLKLVDAVTSALDAPAVFDPIPKLMRNYERDTETRLARNGFNISPVLAKLCQINHVLIQDKAGRFVRNAEGKLVLTKVSGKETADRILARIRQLPDEPFTGFDFTRTKNGDVMFGFKTPDHAQPVNARLLSDGTLRALAILAALETSPMGQHLILEEFDNGVHPSRVHVLAEALFDCATRNKLRVLATTQNPATLNSLTDEQLNAVLLVVHDSAKRHSRLLPLRELPGYIEFLEQGRLGDLVTRRVYEQHLKDGYETERLKDVNEWLEALP